MGPHPDLSRELIVPGWRDQPLSRSRWERVVRFVMVRDEGLCQIRGPRCTGAATTGDHVVPLVMGGAPYDPRNVRAACAACNYSSGAALSSRAGRLGAPSRRWR